MEENERNALPISMIAEDISNIDPLLRFHCSIKPESDPTTRMTSPVKHILLSRNLYY